MTLLQILLWGLLIAIAVMTLADFALTAARHAIWRQRWKTDEVARFHAYRLSLDRARQAHPAGRHHHRHARQHR